MGMLVAVLVALVTIPSIQASAGDHKIPQTYLKKGAKELQAGIRVAESNWARRRRPVRQ